MERKLANILAIIIGVLPINLYMIWYRSTHSEIFTIFEMLVYPLAFGGGNILLILALNRYLLKQKLSNFNPGKGKWVFDLGTGVILTIIFFVLFFIERTTLAGLLPQSDPPSSEIINLMTSLANDPLLLLVWLGPVVWLGIAAFEEIVRVFFLNCLWNLSSQKIWQGLSIVVVSLIIGFVHLYQGTFGIVSISIQSLVMGIFYYKFRRIWPLIISHALYDSTQIIMFVIQVR